MNIRLAGDPPDPLAVLRDLPGRERAEFLRQYRAAVNAARDQAGHEHLLRAWGLAAIAAGRAGYYEEIAAVRAGTAPTVPAASVIPDWPGRLAAARRRRRG